ncbi:hypothetical protein [Pseudomonas sp.]
MKLTLAALKVHLAHCSAYPSIRRNFGVMFTASGIPEVGVPPVRR